MFTDFLNQYTITADHYLLKYWPPDHISDQNSQLRYIWMRPYAYEFLDRMHNLTNISYWTASNQNF